VPRAPLPDESSIGATSRVASEGITPPSLLIRAHAPDLVPLGASGLRRPRVFAGCRQPLLGPGPSRHYLCNPCLGAWTHTPPSPLSASAQSFLKGPGLAPREPRSADGTTPATQLPQGAVISGRQSFASLQAPTLARPPDCADRDTHRCRAAGPFTPRIAWPVTRSRMWYRYMSVSGRLIWLVSHQLGCSPIGCSFPHTALQRQADRSGESVHRVRQPRRGQRVPAQDHRKARPRHAPPLTPTVQPLPPGPRELVLKAREAANIPRHPLVLIVSPEDAAQILPLDRDARCRCCRHHAATRLSARRIRWAAVRRRTLNRPVRLCPQM